MSASMDLAVEQWVGCPSVRSALGAASVAEARARLVDHDGGSPEDHGGDEVLATALDGSAFDPVPPFGVLTTTPEPAETAGVGLWSYRGSELLTLFLPRRLAGETAPQAQARARAVRDAIADETEARFGAAGCLATGSVEVGGPFRPDELGTDQDALIVTITISWHT